jgi:hypothetical protein
VKEEVVEEAVEEEEEEGEAGEWEKAEGQGGRDSYKHIVIHANIIINCSASGIAIDRATHCFGSTGSRWT